MNTDLAFDTFTVATDWTEHVICCRNEDVSLCHLDVSKEPWNTDAPDCKTCAEREDTGYCPLGLVCP